MSKPSRLWSIVDRRIHPPLLPLTTQDSQRLLDTIKNSFRAQLEKEHGLTDTIQATPSTTATNKVQSISNATTEPPRAFARPTDQHLHSILKNPLFSHQQQLKRQVVPASSVESDKMIFKQAVAKGLMNITRAHGFLLKVAGQKNTEPPVAKIENHGVGTLVLEWLRDSGQHRGLKWFSSSPEFGGLLIRFLLAEGHDELLLIWLDQLMTKEVSLGATGEWGITSMVFRELIKAKTLDPTLDDAYRTFLTGMNMLEGYSLSGKFFSTAWRELCWSTTVLAWKYPKVPAHLFEPFAASKLAKDPRDPRAHELPLAHLGLHHPEKPSVELALEWLRRHSFGYPAKMLLPAGSLEMARCLERLTSFGIDTAQHLLLSNQEEEAKGVMEYVKKITKILREKDHGLLPEAAP
ncbi:hypothetical protein QBC35DRAFT_185217 [Podospora australis]|uniref:Uncharacterized protein n=1 Tax=Podospora australis TaxID=1536484 RepID=A0AAN7AIR3_9PEZI|nr:hypothetical protein QBC35DRAFT_185217 [Podospora australis]